METIEPLIYKNISNGWDGMVWRANSLEPGKALIIIDDSWDQASSQKSVDVYAACLPQLYALAPALVGISCVAFLDLPTPNQLRGDPDCKSLCQAVLQVVKDTRDCIGTYFLVDNFFGNRADDSALIGPTVRASLENGLNINVRAKKIASLSVGGAGQHHVTPSEDSYPIFIKANIEEYARKNNCLTRGLLEWLDMNLDTLAVEKRLWPDGQDCWRGNLLDLLWEIEDVGANWTVSSHNPETWDFSTAGWFDGSAVVPHTCSDTEKTKAAIRSYLTNLFGFVPPNHWFGEDEFCHLYEHLKYLIGACARAQGAGNYLTKVGCCVLLMAAAGQEYAKDWIQRFHWTMGRSRPFLPKDQNRDQARDAIIKLCTVFEHLRSIDGTTNPCVLSVTLSENSFKAILGFPSDISDEASLPSKVRAFDASATGQVYQAYLAFLRACGTIDNGYWPECAMGFKAEGEKTVIRIKC